MVGWSLRSAEQDLLQEYLQERCSHYHKHAPQTQYPMPSHTSVVLGQIVRTPNPDADRTGWPSIEDSSDSFSFAEAVVQALRFMKQSEAQAMLRALQEYEEEGRRVTGRLMEVNEALGDRSVERQREIAEESFPVTATLSRSARSRGQPRLPFPWIPLVSNLCIAGMVLVEAWQFAIPYLNATGIDISNLPHEWVRDKISILLGAGFALATSFGIFVLWDCVLGKVLSILKDLGRQTVWQKVLKELTPPLLIASLLIATSFGIGAMRHHLSQGAGGIMEALDGETLSGQGANGVFVLLTIIVPLAAAFLHHKIEDMWTRRQRTQEERERWSQDEHEHLLVRERRTELMRLVDDERNHLEKRREAVRDNIREIAQRAQAAERLIREHLEAARRYTVAFANSLVAALEQDRYYFLKAARKRGAYDLIDGQACELGTPPSNRRDGNGQSHNDHSYQPALRSG